MKNTTKGFASVLLIIGVIVLVVAGYFLYSRMATKDVMNNNDNEKMQTVSDSDDPSVISQEFDETELNIDEFETELTVLEADIKGL